MGSTVRSLPSHLSAPPAQPPPPHAAAVDDAAPSPTIPSSSSSPTTGDYPTGEADTADDEGRPYISSRDDLPCRAELLLSLRRQRIHEESRSLRGANEGGEGSSGGQRRRRRCMAHCLGSWRRKRSLGRLAVEAEAARVPMGGGGGCLGIDDGDRGASPSLASAPPVGSALACRHPRLPLRCLDPTAFAHRHSLMEVRGGRRERKRGGIGERKRRGREREGEKLISGAHQFFYKKNANWTAT